MKEILVTSTLVAVLLTSCLPISNAVTSYLTTITRKTPIRYLMIIYDENISFDHFFATYPHAENPPGGPTFDASEKYSRLEWFDRDAFRS